jgi:hypothetical protein
MGFQIFLFKDWWKNKQNKEIGEKIWPLKRACELGI